MSKYPKVPKYGQLTSLLELEAQLKAEYGAKGIGQTLARAERALRRHTVMGHAG